MYLLLGIARVHWVVLASTTAISGVGDVNNPVRGAKWLGRHQEGLPILAAGRREDLGSLRAAVAFRRPSNILAACAGHHRSSRVGTVEGNSPAMPRFK